jgi:hypothetical protein
MVSSTVDIKKMFTFNVAISKLGKLIKTQSYNKKRKSSNVLMQSFMSFHACNVNE